MTRIDQIKDELLRINVEASGKIENIKLIDLLKAIQSLADHVETLEIKLQQSK